MYGAPTRSFFGRSDVAHALMRAASRLVSTLAFELSSHTNKRRDESRRRTHECVRHSMARAVLKPLRGLTINDPSSGEAGTRRNNFAASVECKQGGVHSASASYQAESQSVCSGTVEARERGQRCRC